MLIPLGTSAAVDGGELFTLTAVDPATGWFAGMGHLPLVGADLMLRDVWPLTCRKKNGELDVRARGTEPLGTVQRKNEYGVSGTLLREAEGEAVPMADAHPGPAVIRSDAGAIAIQIITVKDGYIWWDSARIAPARGMSGAPVIQDGCLVGALHGRLGSKYQYRAGTAVPIADVCRALLPGYEEKKGD